MNKSLDNTKGQKTACVCFFCITKNTNSSRCQCKREVKLPAVAPITNNVVNGKGPKSCRRYCTKKMKKKMSLAFLSIIKRRYLTSAGLFDLRLTYKNSLNGSTSNISNFRFYFNFQKISNLKYFFLQHCRSNRNIYF